MRTETTPSEAKRPPIYVASLVSLLLAACSANRGRGEGVDTDAMPADVRSDYATFAQRCSKCHGLARPLDVGITSDEHWSSYVERMRRQPGSGISAQDATAILRFLHYYSTEVVVQSDAKETK